MYVYVCSNEMYGINYGDDFFYQQGNNINRSHGILGVLQLCSVHHYNWPFRQCLSISMNDVIIIQPLAGCNPMIIDEKQSNTGDYTIKGQTLITVYTANLPRGRTIVSKSQQNPHLH